MIHIPIDQRYLASAKEAHIRAVTNYVMSKEQSYQEKLFHHISQVLPQEKGFAEFQKDGDWSWLEAFILADVDRLTSFAANKELLQFDAFKEIYSRKFCNGATVYVDSTTKYNAYAFCEYLNVMVCPYCDEEYLDILKTDGKKPIRTLEIDHFYSKSEYPALAMCFYNLVPSGQNCNGIKKAELLGMNPYEAEIEECTHLYPDFPVGINMDRLSVSDCTIKFHPTHGMIQNVEKLRLEERYERHKGIAHKYITNLQFYTDEKIDELVRMGFLPSKDAAYRDLFDIPLPEDREQRLLTKLRKDIVGK